jgi:hypothetical protein
VRLLWWIPVGTTLVASMVAVISPIPLLNFGCGAVCLIVSLWFGRVYRRLFNHGEINLIRPGIATGLARTA